jgi:putative solute:sodium symporter small subunit
MSNQSDNYWRANIKLILLCLAIWFSVSYLCGIIFVEQLNLIMLGGYKLGFWFSQQGAIYAFVALIFFYNWRVNKLDKKFKQDENS